jgi:hypothetical protein
LVAVELEDITEMVAFVEEGITELVAVVVDITGVVAVVV